MGKLSRGILGAFSGKVGEVVGGTWNGISYIRAMPSNVKDAKTEKQMAQRQRFGLMVKLLYSLKYFLNISFSGGARGQSAVNQAMSVNLPTAITGDYPDQQIDYSMLKVARGNLTNVFEASVAADNPGEVNITWTDNTDIGSAKGDDTALMLLINTDKGLPLYVTDGPARSDEGATVTLPDPFAGDTLEAYLAFRSADGDMVSDSLYLGSVEALTGS